MHRRNSSSSGPASLNCFYKLPGGKNRRRGRDIGSPEPSQISVPGSDLILDQREITVHLMPEGGLRQAAIGMDGVNLCHF